jgi:pyruvate,water dikinase
VSPLRRDPVIDRVVTGDGTVWTRPGPGTWESAADHLPHAITAAMAEVYLPARAAGMRDFFGRYGMPAAGYDGSVVNGRVYDRVVPLVGADSDAPPPPAPILWFASRVHPEFRRRTKRMRDTWAEPRRWRSEAAGWLDRERQSWIDRNLALTDEDPATLDDAAFIDHLHRVVTHCQAAIERHFSIKGVDSAPLGDLLAFTNEHGIDSSVVLDTLRGASPSSGAPATLVALAAEVRATGARPATLADVRALGPGVATALDAYLREHGCRIVTGYDIDGKTLNEVPDAVVRSIMAVVDRPPSTTPVPDATACESLVPLVPVEARAELRARFAEGLLAYGIRDDNGPLTFQWPVGLLRRAMIEAGIRLVARGKLDEADHVIELRTDETLALLRGASAPNAEEARARGERRARQTALAPPDRLGPEPPPLPLAALPEPLARGIRAIEAFIECMTGSRDDRVPLTGTGIGRERYVGRAVVAITPEEAFVRLEPGDVLVAACTTPAYNCILPIVGAIVTEEGGGLSHAAIVARELGIAAVVGARDATTAIKDGDEVEVDPVAGTVAVAVR